VKSRSGDSTTSTCPYSSRVGDIPGVVVPIIGWIVDRSGSYAGGLASAAVVGAIGLVTWLVFETGKKVID
jgi:hypothetical protein